jgi:hypothetical protein
MEEREDGLTDHTVRNLAHLKHTASSARVLNLLRTSVEFGEDPEWAERPFFDSLLLNRSLIIKHRLRRNEADLFPTYRQVATKVVIPIDFDDLRSGGRYFYVGQNQFANTLRENFAIDLGTRDAQILSAIDRLPSLDPFLLREQLRRAGFSPASCYFAISPADLNRMSEFVQQEIRPLVAMSLEQHGDVTSEYSVRRLAGKLLSPTPGQDLEALRLTLRLDPEQYEEGVFCWKGFLYYKWVLSDLLNQLGEVLHDVRTVKPVGPMDGETRHYLSRSRDTLRQQIVTVCEKVRTTLVFYDEAYRALIHDNDPVKFRDFLLRAPTLFTRLGEQLGAVQHITSFWRFRFRHGPGTVTPEELLDIFMDFETGLKGSDTDSQDLAPAA